jgi:hypothetical protein
VVWSNTAAIVFSFKQIVAVDFEHEFGGHTSFEEANRSAS